jgi:hypothetical protein
MVLSAKRELEIVHQEAIAPGLDPAHRASLVSSAVKLREQLMDLLGTPKRPASAPGGKRTTPMLDVSPGFEPPPDLPNV